MAEDSPVPIIKPFTSLEIYEISFIDCHGEESSFWTSKETLLLDIVEELNFNSYLTDIKLISD